MKSSRCCMARRRGRGAPCRAYTCRCCSWRTDTRPAEMLALGSDDVAVHWLAVLGAQHCRPQCARAETCGREGFAQVRLRMAVAAEWMQLECAFCERLDREDQPAAGA